MENCGGWGSSRERGGERWGGGQRLSRLSTLSFLSSLRPSFLPPTPYLRSPFFSPSTPPSVPPPLLLFFPPWKLYNPARSLLQCSASAHGLGAMSCLLARVVLRDALCGSRAWVPSLFVRPCSGESGEGIGRRRLLVLVGAQAWGLDPAVLLTRLGSLGAPSGGGGGGIQVPEGALLGFLRGRVRVLHPSHYCSLPCNTPTPAAHLLTLPPQRDPGAEGSQRPSGHIGW